MSIVVLKLDKWIRKRCLVEYSILTFVIYKLRMLIFNDCRVYAYLKSVIFRRYFLRKAHIIKIIELSGWLLLLARLINRQVEVFCGFDRHSP